VAGFSVDAQSGEVYPSEDPFVGWLETVQGEKVPHLDLGELSHPDLAFPPKIRAQRPYLYVGYLGSAIWRGQVSGKKDYSAVVKYRGKTWTLKADSREALVDGAPRQFPQSPLMIRGYLYLPACLIEAITGWHMTYVPRENTVYLYTTASRSSPQHDG
ncbi:copper amine oxidase N-terminal domain-containing protein, partial [bacterium]|nr:copper amine oxidase N-terminal domain-containing protein [bacterium]